MKEYIRGKYHMYVKSIYIGDTIVYADFLNNAEGDDVLSRTLKEYVEENIEECEDIATIKFDIICAMTDLVETDDESEDIKLPPVVFSGIRKKNTPPKKKTFWNLLPRVFGETSDQ